MFIRLKPRLSKDEAIILNKQQIVSIKQQYSLSADKFSLVITMSNGLVYEADATLPDLFTENEVVDIPKPKVQMPTFTQEPVSQDPLMDAINSEMVKKKKEGF